MQINLSYRQQFWYVYLKLLRNKKSKIPDERFHIFLIYIRIYNL